MFRIAVAASRRMPSRRALTPKMARFCSLVARGQHLSEAYRRSYDAKGMRDASVRVESSKLRKLPHVDEAITKLRAMHEPTERTVEALEGDWVLLRLWEEAVSKSNPASARVRSLEVNRPGLTGDSTS